MRRLAALVVTVAVMAGCGADQPEARVTTTPSVTDPVVASPTVPAPTETAATDQPTPAGTFAVFDPPPEGQNWMQVSEKGGASLNQEPELCLIVDEGRTGKIETMNFALNCAEGEWILTWLHVGGTYQGPVEGAVDGLDVTFEGEVEGMAVVGSVT